MNSDNIRSTATEELKLLSSIIGRIEEAIYQKQGWLFTLITGLTLALLKEDPLLCKAQFAVISIAITVIFYIADVVQRVPVHRAIRRSKVIEKFLSGKENTYSGPDISGSLGQGEDIKDDFSFFFKIRVLAPYVGILVMVAIIYKYAS